MAKDSFNRDQMRRRRFMQVAGAGLAAGAIQPAIATIARGQPLVTATTAPAARQRVGRIAHLTDVHVQPERAGEAGFVECLHHVQAHARPDLVLFGGDAVFNVNDVDAARRDLLGAMWQRVLKAELSTPFHAAIGNHDTPDTKGLIESKAGDDAVARWACDLFALDKRYYSFDQFGWHIVVLDSVRVGGPQGYEGRIDDEQLAWLTADLAAAKAKPVLVLSHIPIITVTGFFDGDRIKSGDWDVPRSFMHVDANRLHELFIKAGNVKLCISGHEHQLDRCLFDGITYACNGAVCGNWWQGTYHHTEAGYAVVDLFDNGEFDIAYHSYGWTARA